jgi:hypothetical protein
MAPASALERFRPHASQQNVFSAKDLGHIDGDLATGERSGAESWSWREAAAAIPDAGAKKGARKSVEKTVSLSAWLTTQQKEGRRN